MSRFAILLLVAFIGSAAAAELSRERVLINDNWRFIEGDPTNINSKSLLYDVRPVARGEDERERLAVSVLLTASSRRPGCSAKVCYADHANRSQAPDPGATREDSNRLPT